MNRVVERHVSQPMDIFLQCLGTKEKGVINSFSAEIAFDLALEVPRDIHVLRNKPWEGRDG